MTFLKFLKIREKRKAQAAMEYFILLCVITAIVIAGLRTTFLQRVHQATEQFFQKEATRIVEADSKVSALSILDGVIAAYYLWPN